MSTPLKLCLAFAIFSIFTPARSQEPAALGENLFTPDALLQQAEKLKLTENQKKAMMALLQQTESRFAEAQKILGRKSEELNTALRPARINKEEALQKLDQVLQAENKLKQLHFSVLIELKNLLTPEQQQAAKQLGFSVADSDQFREKKAKVLKDKIQKIQQLMEEKQKEGIFPVEVTRVMDRFQGLMAEGKLKEAEDLLDQALKMLTENAPLQ